MPSRRSGRPNYQQLCKKMPLPRRVPDKAVDAFENGNESALNKHVRKGDTFLGAGSFGVTVSRTISGQPVAVKYVFDEFEIDEAAIQMDAAQITANAAQVFAACHRRTPGTGLVLMEPLPGPQFFAIDFPADVVRAAIAQLLEALEALHDAGIYHRDIKPENVMFDKDPMVHDDWTLKLIDWGLACRRRECHDRVGTSWYAPPEWELQESEAFAEGVARRGYDLYAAHDVWAVGVMIANVCTGGDCDMIELPTIEDIPEDTDGWHMELATDVEATVEAIGADPVEVYWLLIEDERENFVGPIGAWTPTPGYEWSKVLVQMLLEPDLFRRATASDALEVLDALE